MHWVGLLAGFLMATYILADGFATMLVPRRLRQQIRFVPHFFRLTWRVYSGYSQRYPPGEQRETFLSFYAPLSMVVLISSWAIGLIISFALMAWGLEQGRTDIATAQQFLYWSGVTFFTLGYGDITPRSPLGQFLAVVEAGTGFAFIAVVIGYLPVLYQLFSRRETHVIQLDARAGAPPSAGTLLSRHAEGYSMDDLYALLRDWESWSAELVESHLSYPMLSYYRSQHHNLNWLGSLTSVMDTCAVMLVGLRGVRTFPARMTFAMARLAAVELCRTFQLRTPPVRENRLPPDQFQALQRCMNSVGIPFSDLAHAEERLAAFRATYEPFLCALSSYLLLPMPGFHPEKSLDNWQTSPRGRRAAELVRDTEAVPE